MVEKPDRNRTVGITKKEPMSITHWLIMAAQAGIEPVLELLQACVAAAASEIAANPDAQLRAQKLGELREFVAAWSNLSPALRAAVLAVARTATERHG
jgi:hypothetical protein